MARTESPSSCGPQLTHHSPGLEPIGWSRDGAWIYAEREPAMELVRVPAGGGGPEPWLPSAGVGKVLESVFCETELNYASSTATFPLEIWIDPMAADPTHHQAATPSR